MRLANAERPGEPRGVRGESELPVSERRHQPSAAWSWRPACPGRPGSGPGIRSRPGYRRRRRSRSRRARSRWAEARWRSQPRSRRGHRASGSPAFAPGRDPRGSARTGRWRRRSGRWWCLSRRSRCSRSWRPAKRGRPAAAAISERELRDGGRTTAGWYAATDLLIEGLLCGRFELRRHRVRPTRPRLGTLRVEAATPREAPRSTRGALEAAGAQRLAAAPEYLSDPGVVSDSPVSSSVFRPERIIGQPP